ncbi:MAG TPA: flagellar hook basal-body protein, partial [Xanthobacteraceae bacterium]|nr:flagellar hook basal-body protein [Xanthobacteraceae bacterium]
MFSSILSAFSGMLGFSKGLDVISNNVANLNTPGFKAAELQFRDLFYRYSPLQGGGAEQVGQGVSAGNTRTRYRQGELRETGNPLDLAIDGNGFFVLRKDGETFFTRSGQFEFNGAGVL